MRRLVIAFALLCAIVLSPQPANAHEIGVSSGDYALQTASGSVTVKASLTLAQREMLILVPELDPDHDGAIANADLAGARDGLQREVVDRVVVTGDGARCAGAFIGARLTENDGLVVDATYDCRPPPAKMHIEVALVSSLSLGHRHFAHVKNGDVAFDETLFRDHAGFDLVPGKPSEGSHGDTSIWSLFRMGIEHILTGYDHLVFLLGLVLVGGRPRALIGVVTAFTIAHSISLALAVLGVLAPSPRIVEPAIALSIAYVGVENFFVKDAAKRWRITFPFGLIHGFGFAGALQEIGLPRARVPIALLMFNLGVEAGQLAVLALVLPIILFLRKRGGSQRWVQVVSAAIVVAGVIWFFERLRARS